jgi:aconitate hydratase
VVPPATGIVHQVNLEYLAGVVLTKDEDGATVAYPDSLVGTDSHTTMINGLGVVGWGVGGIEAEAVMLGQPVYMLTPEVIGFRLKGKLPEGATATDLVLTVTEILRAHGVVDKFVEFCGDGLAALSLPDRATIANMAPEYGATMGFFPVDKVTLDYLRLTGRPDDQVALVEAYTKANHLFFTPGSPEPEFTDLLELDLATVEPSLAGPKRPQDRIALRDMLPQWRKDLVDTFGKRAVGQSVNLNRWAGEGGNATRGNSNPEVAEQGANGGANGVPVEMDGRAFTLKHGDVVIAAITSCTNTSNPDVMIAAGLVARKARKLGLTRAPWVKTSLAPGSKVVTEYFDKSGLTEDLDALGFNTVGYGCTTCIGNSGPLPEPIDAAIAKGDLVAASVLSGNRNFEGRVHPSVRANYLASPPLVVAYAIAGTIDIDLANDPIATADDGRPVYLKNIWPTQQEIRELRAACIGPDQFRRQYGNVYTGNETWNNVPVSKSALYPWEDSSTYIQNPPFFEGLRPDPDDIRPITGARCLALLGHSVTTDHISPAGAIAENSPAGQYLKSKGVAKKDFNSYGSRRGNDRIMTRGTFANIRVKNRLAPGTEGGLNTDFTKSDKVGGADGKTFTTIFEASESYRKAGTPLVVLAGKDYGMGSSRDWAAKGTFLLGVHAVIAESFERIHRSNLGGMGVLPLTFAAGATADSLGLDGTETFDIRLPEPVEPRCNVPVTATKPDGRKIEFTARCRMDTPVEIEYYRNGGILQTVLRKLLNESKVGAA